MPYRDIGCAGADVSQYRGQLLAAQPRKPESVLYAAVAGRSARGGDTPLSRTRATLTGRMRAPALMDEMPDLAGASSGNIPCRARAATKSGAMPPRRLGTYLEAAEGWTNMRACADGGGGYGALPKGGSGALLPAQST